MEILRQEPELEQECARGYTVSIRIRSFKGRRNVLVHLFRPYWKQDEIPKFLWKDLIQTGPPLSERGDSRKVILETFTRSELDTLLEYLSSRYADRLDEIRTGALSLPVPKGLVPLCQMPEGKDMGRIRFELVPGYALPVIVHGFYNLRQHRPINNIP